jgi:hypothetical protein
MGKPRTLENLNALLADMAADIASVPGSDDDERRRLRRRQDKLWREWLALRDASPEDERELERRGIKLWWRRSA